MSAPVFDKVLIGGRWEKAANGTYPVVDPTTEEVVGHAPSASPDQARAAARAARVAFESGPWGAMSGTERAGLLREATEAFRREMGSLVDLTIAETGALKFVAETQQVGATAARLGKYAGLAADMPQEVFPPTPMATGGTSAGIAVHEPVGTVACITPYNFPMTNCAGKIGPALACGNTVVVKPAPVNPLGVSELCRIVGAVLPAGVVNFVCGPGADVGEALSRSPDIDMVSFTGSTAVGCAIQAAAAPRMARVLMELGGKSAFLVFADCDRARAVRQAVAQWTFHAGQICIAGTRLLVEASIYDDFTAELAKAAAAVRVGDPRETGVVMGPLVSAAARDRVESYVATGVAEGAKIACGGRRPPHLPKGFFFEPTLFTGVRNDMRIAREEIFGPVLVAIPFRDEAEAIAIANDSDYGLYGYVWSRDTAHAFRVARALRTGTVQINGSPPNPDAPFGGYKLSGVGRDGGRYALNAYTETKYIGWTA